MKVKQLFEDSIETLEQQLITIKNKIPKIKEQMGKNVLYNKMNAIKKEIEKKKHIEKEKLAAQQLKKKDPEGYKNFIMNNKLKESSDYSNVQQIKNLRAAILRTKEKLQNMDKPKFPDQRELMRKDILDMEEKIKKLEQE